MHAGRWAGLTRRKTSEPIRRDLYSLLFLYCQLLVALVFGVLLPVLFRSGAWDAGGVSNPELVETDGGMWYLYYAGHPERAEGGERSSKSAIGVAVAVGDDLSRWTRLET